MTDLLKKVRQQEIHERYFLSNFIPTIPDCKITKLSKIGSFERYDIIFISACTNGKYIKFVGDAKIRTKSYDSTFTMQYGEDNYGVFIEPHKYDFLIAKAKAINAYPVFINYYTDGVVTIHNLLKENIFTSKNKLRYLSNTGQHQLRHILNDKCAKFQYDLNSLLEKDKDNLQTITDFYTNDSNVNFYNFILTL